MASPQTLSEKADVLNVLSPSTYQAYEWVKSNRYQFTGQIYGPVMLEINYDKAHKSKIESIIEVDLMSFICVNINDMNKLLKTVRDGMKLPINVCLAPAENYYSPVRENSSHTDQSTFILDKIEGPAPVLNYLCKYFYLHKRALIEEFEQPETNGLSFQTSSCPSDFNDDDCEASSSSNPYSGKTCTDVDGPQEIVTSHSIHLLDQPFEGQKDEANKTLVNEGTKVICNICGKEFKSRRTKSNHLKNIHGVTAKEKVVLKPVKDKISCVFCDKKYCNAFTLQRHLETIHLYDDKKMQLYSCSKCQYKTPHKHHLTRHMAKHNTCNNDSVSEVTETQQWKCPQCEAQYKYKRSLTQHKKKAHGIINDKLSICRKCPMCSFSSNTFLKTDIYKHFEEVHSYNMKWEHHEFKSQNEFQIWKEVIEKTTVASYFKSQTMSKNHFTYQCNRCGTYKHKGRGLRNAKMTGSCKINSFCPSEIKVKQIGETIKVKYLAQHVGHKPQIEHTRLSFQDRKHIALKLMNKVPQKEILRSIRATLANKELQRLHLTNAADINNIKASLNLQDDWKKHRSDVVSTEAWITELKQSKNTSVLVYKGQGELMEQFPEFEEKDFLLIYMTKVQKLVLEKHGRETVCIDSTFGLNNYNFQMFTILTLDETREGFPVAFMFSNRSDEIALKRFYSEIHNATGPISTNTFMSDMDETLYSAWVKVMGAAEKRLFCAWHVIRALKKNIKKKIKNKEQQDITTKVVTSLVYERDEAAFFRILHPFLLRMKNNSHTKLFYDYFSEYYLSNGRYKLWAYCFRLHGGINTNMSLENFNKVLKYFYLQGKKVLRMDQAVFAVVNLIRDKVYDLIIKMTKGKITTKLRNLRKAHKRSLAIDLNHIMISSENAWEVLSSAQTEFYIVQRVKSCGTCHLQCSHCSTCFHEFSCSCLENAIKNNMCKHIHAVCRKISPISISALETNTNAELDEELRIDTVLQEMKESDEVQFVVEKNTLIEELKAMLTNLEPKLYCKEQLEFLKKEMTKINTVVEAIGSSEGKVMSDQSLPGTSKKLLQQRRFVSTKKQLQKKENSNNSEKIIADLLFESSMQSEMPSNSKK